ncbi:MotA/TolQ/ExbB proton channel family protein [Gemmatimonadota bacterium]
MFDFIRGSGPYGLLICGLVLLNLGLVGWILVKLLGNGGGRSQALEGKINAVLFWGGIGAVLGVLGQVNSIYLALREILSASDISPNVIAEGFAISFTSTIMGLLLLLFSALAWMGLRGLYNRTTRVAVPI